MNWVEICPIYDHDIICFCLQHSCTLLILLFSKPYAVKMLDAASKVPSGLYEGKRLWMGSFDECYNVQSDVIPSTGRLITGKYCMSLINTTGNPIIGYCVPSTCNNTNADVLIKILMQQEKLNFGLLGTTCKEDQTLSHGAIASIVVISLIIAVVFFGTLLEFLLIAKEQLFPDHSHLQMKHGYTNIYDTNERTGLLADNHTSTTSFNNDSGSLASKPSQASSKFITKFMLSFSFITNTKKLLSTHTSSGPLACLNGMRVLSMWWVILGHSFQFAYTSAAMDNPLDALNIGKRFTFQAILNGTFSVDTFFFLSGLLVTYLCLKNLVEKNGRINWGLFYFHRFWRLTPVYGFVLMIWGSLTVYLLNGPGGIIYRNDKVSMQIIDICSTTWWANLLYINNFYPHLGDLGNQCMSWTWYLANDMQFFIISPLIIILMYRYRKAAVAVCIFLIAGCIFSRGVSVLYYGLHIPNQGPTKHADEPLAKHGPLYNKPYTRIAPYIVGMIVGMVLHAHSFRLRLPKLATLLGWCAAIATGMSVVYGQLHYYQDIPKTIDSSLTTSVFYISLNRFAWSVALAWVVIACATGKGGPVNVILSWKVWAPLGRLTYCAYLVHPILLQYYLLNLHSSFHYTDTIMVYYYVANVVITYMIAFLVSMVVEAPLLGLEKLILGALRL